MAILFCHKCGKKLSNDVDFCIYCGAKAIKLEGTISDITTLHDSESPQKNTAEIEKENISIMNACTSLNNSKQSLDNSAQESIKDSDITTDDYSIWSGIAFIVVMLIYGLLFT